MSPEEQKQVEEKELRIAQLEQRIANIDKLLTDSQSKATFPALKTAKQELIDKSIELYGELSPFYEKK